jgi:hypothetical protein
MKILTENTNPTTIKYEDLTVHQELIADFMEQQMTQLETLNLTSDRAQYISNLRSLKATTEKHSGYYPKLVSELRIAAIEDLICLAQAKIAKCENVDYTAIDSRKIEEVILSEILEDHWDTDTSTPESDDTFYTKPRARVIDVEAIAIENESNRFERLRKSFFGKLTKLRENLRQEEKPPLTPLEIWKKEREADVRSKKALQSLKVTASVISAIIAAGMINLNFNNPLNPYRTSQNPEQIASTTNESNSEYVDPKTPSLQVPKTAEQIEIDRIKQLTKRIQKQTMPPQDIAYQQVTQKTNKFINTPKSQPEPVSPLVSLNSLPKYHIPDMPLQVNQTHIPKTKTNNEAVSRLAKIKKEAREDKLKAQEQISTIRKEQLTILTKVGNFRIITNPTNQVPSYKEGIFDGNNLSQVVEKN